MIKIKVGAVYMYIDENIAKRYYPHLLNLPQDNTEKQETNPEMLLSDTEKEASSSPSASSEQTSPRRSRKKANLDTEASSEER
ncbi:TPA: hypothetical protein [Thermocrinis Great Boiling Spring virus]|jgi:hypothetical protein|nr:TPA: hypothetical protein [Thermocrinis Great Boiling Spring virus]